MKLIDVLNLSTFKDATVVAGQLGLTNPVQSVNLMDAPDIIHYLNAEQLLLTTAYSLHHDRQALIELVQQMAKQGCAGLGLKTKRYIEDIPEEIITEANKLNFPIIELPLHYSLGEMLNESLGCILKERTEELNYALNTHKEFSNIVMSGGGFSSVIASLSSLLDAPVVLLNYRLDILSSSHRIDQDSFFEVYWHIHDLIHRQEIEQYLALTLPNEETSSPYKEFSLYPINTVNQQKVYVVILGKAKSHNNSSLLAIEQASNVISFEFMKLHALEQHSRRLKNEFFTDLIDGTIATEEEIQSRGKTYALDKSLQYVCITFKIDGGSDYSLENYPLQAEKEMNNKRDVIYELVEVLIGKQYNSSIVFSKGDLFGILIGFDFYNESVEKNLLDVIRQTQDEVYHTLDIGLSFGISNIAEKLNDIGIAFQEAVDSLRMGYRENKNKFIKTYRTKELTELLKTIPSQKLKEFYQSSLKELAYPKDKEKKDLVKTLSYFLNNNCQIAETAKSMFVHRNTVIYRIKKCEELLGRDIKSSDETMRLRMAFFIQSFLLQK